MFSLSLSASGPEVDGVCLPLTECKDIYNNV